MKTILTVLCFLLVLSACGGSKIRLGTPVSLPPGPITVPNSVRYSAGNTIANNIKQECSLNQQLAAYIQEFAAEKGLKVRGVDVIDTGTTGNVLDVEITHALSAGNTFIGHRKSTSVRGELYQNGKFLASFTGSRVSGGGVFGGYKGSCSVLGRTVKVLGQDIATWLKQPTNNAHLGN